jgi:hypothetical protein
MASKTTLDPKLQAWTRARKRHHLSHAHVQMARELGMNPTRLGKLDNHDQEPWKAPLPLFNRGSLREAVWPFPARGGAFDRGAGPGQGQEEGSTEAGQGGTPRRVRRDGRGAVRPPLAGWGTSEGTRTVVVLVGDTGAVPIDPPLRGQQLRHPPGSCSPGRLHPPAAGAHRKIPRWPSGSVCASPRLPAVPKSCATRPAAG